MTDIQTALFANDTFYTAFANRDPDAMETVWAEDTQITCLHPGWPPLAGRDTVLDSWRAILTAESAPDVEWRAPEAFLAGDTARVVCYEVVGDVTLVATNLFVKEGAAWRLVHHQSGPCPKAPPADERPPIA